MYPPSVFQLLPISPHFQLEPAVTIDKFEIFPIRSNQARSVRASGESYEDVEMQVAKFRRGEAMIGMHRGKYLTRFQPILLRGSQDCISSRQRPKKLPIRGLRRTPPQLRQHHRRRSDGTED